MNLLSTQRGRRLLFSLLYVSEGAPIGFLWWALPTTLRAEGVPVEQITALTSLLVLPWAFKFAWAPLVDAMRSSRWTYRSWILAMQFLMGLTLVPLLFLDPGADFALIYPLLLAHACVAATQDVAIDALSIATVPVQDRGSINGWMQAGMLAGRSVFGGGVLVLQGVVGETGVYLLLIGVIWAIMGLLFVFAGHPKKAPDRLTVREKWGEFAGRMLLVARNRRTWFGLLFALLGGAAFEGVGGVAGPYMIDRGLTEEDVGWFFALPAVLAMVGGALLGGHLSDQFGRRRTVTAFLLLVAIAVCSVASLDFITAGSPSHTVLVAGLTFLYACTGLFTASTYALFMDLTDPHLGGTQFSAYMGATNGCEGWSTFAMGQGVAAFGYPVAFVLMAAASLLALPLLWWSSGTVGQAGKQQE